MKRTTYILIGIFLANLLLSIIGLFYIKLTMVSADELRYELNIAKKVAVLDLKGVETIEFSEVGMGHEIYYIETPGKINVHSSTGGDEGLTYPVSDYVKVDRQGSVVKVVVDYSLIYKHIDDSFRGNRVVLNGLQFVAKPDENLKTFCADRGFEVLLANLKLDTLSLCTDRVEVDSCELGSLELNGGFVHCRRLLANDLHIDLDEINSWTLENCNLDALHLCGSRHYREEVSNSQYKKLIWEPKADDAALSLKLKHKAEVLSVN